MENDCALVIVGHRCALQTSPVKNIAQISPTTRRLQNPSAGAVTIRGYPSGTKSRPAADREVVGLIWGFTILALVFLWLLAAPLYALVALPVLPFLSLIQISLSRVGGSMVWAWFLAVSHGVFCSGVLYFALLA